MTQRFPESNERATPYHLCRVKEPTFSHIPNVGSSAPWLEWPSARTPCWRRPPEFKLVKRTEISEGASAINSHTMERPSTPLRPKRNSNRDRMGKPLKAPYRSSAPSPVPQACPFENVSSDFPPMSLIPPCAPSLSESVYQTAEPIQIPTSSSDVPLSRMSILETVARSATAFSPLAGHTHPKHREIELAYTPTTLTPDTYISSPFISSPLASDGRDDKDIFELHASSRRGKPTLRTSQASTQHSVENEIFSTSGSRVPSSSAKRKRSSENDSEQPLAAVRASKRRRTPTERAQARTDVPAKKRSGRSGPRAAIQNSPVEQEQAETSQISSPALGSPVFAATARRSKRGSKADDLDEVEVLVSGRTQPNSKVGTSAGARKRRKS